jgi:hypothetical protein
MKTQPASKSNFLKWWEVRTKSILAKSLKATQKEKSANDSGSPKASSRTNGKPLVKIIGIKPYEKTKDVHFIVIRNKELETKGYITTPIEMKNKECKVQILKSINQAKI